MLILSFEAERKSGAGSVRIVFEEHGFPRELTSAEDRARAVDEGSIGPETQVTVYRDSGPPAVVRASAVDELRPLLGLPQPVVEFYAAEEIAAADEVGASASTSLSASSEPVARAPAADVGAPEPHLSWIAPPPSRSKNRLPEARLGEPEGFSAAPRAALRETGSDFPLPLVPLAKYAVFQGRASRAEFWQFAGTLFVCALLASGASSVVLGLLVLGTLLPCIAVTVRRLHDANITGWAVLTSLIPYIGWLILIVLLLLAGTVGPNRHGPGPRGAPGLPG